MRKIENFKKALFKLTDSIKEYSKNENEYLRDSVIQRYEFTIELSWKAIREYLEDQRYTDINSPKKTLKTAYAMDIIDNEKIWIEMLDSRNITSHLYDEKAAVVICKNIISKYVKELENLAEKLDDIE